jgi:hypothetical protein
LRVTLAPHGATLQASQRLASVHVSGVISSSTTAVSAAAIGKPSLGWRLSHLL